MNCEKNRLEEPDLSGNPELIKLYSRHNQLTQLDVRYNTKLQFIETFDNQLTSFDCTMLKDLEFLHIDHNNLTTLDMSQNPNLKGNGFVAANNHLDDLIMPNIPDFEVEAKVFYEQNPKQGYETVKWFYDSMYSREVQETDMIQAEGQKFYAKWIANPYTVYYQPNGGQGEMEPQAVEYDQVFTLTPNTFTRTGYTFQNWNTSSDAVGGKTFTDKEEVSNLAGKNPNKDRLTLYAQWKANTYTIRYDANGGEGHMEDTAAVYDQPAVLSQNQFTRADYVLAGWSLESGDQNEKEYAPGDTVRNLTSVDQQVVTLYAVWITYEELQQEFQDQLLDFFSGYREEDYYSEDWRSLQEINRVAAEGISNAGVDELAMRQALQTAFSSAQQVKTKEQRTEEIVQSWKTAHDEILSQLGASVPMENLEAYRSQAETAVSQSESEWMTQQSTLTDPASRQDAVQKAQNEISSSIGQLGQMQRAIVWLDAVKDWYQVPMGSVKSTDATLYSDQLREYDDLSSEEKVYCDPTVLGQLTVRKYFAEEKQNALEDLDAYFSALKMTDYTEENQKKLAEIMDEAKAEIENADIIGMADRLFLESIDRLKEVEPIIRQKIPSIEIKPTPSALVKGQKLSESRLTGGKAETEGTFSWKDGSVIPLQTGNYPVIFTPKDTEAYLPVEFDVTVSVTDPVPSPDIPDSPDSKPDLTPPSESAPPVDSPLTPDTPSQPGSTVGLDQIHTENQPNGSDPSALGTVLESDPSSASDAGANGTPDKGPDTDKDTVSSGDAGTGEDALADGGTETNPEEAAPQTRDTFILVALLIAGVVVVAGILFFVIRKRK